VLRSCCLTIEGRDVSLADVVVGVERKVVVTSVSSGKTRRR
jgi:hypothetical protein